MDANYVTGHERPTAILLDRKIKLTWAIPGPARQRKTKSSGCFSPFLSISHGLISETYHNFSVLSADA